MESLLRAILFTLAKNRTANRLAKRYGLHFGAKRFVAGETVDSAIAVVRELNQRGLAATLDHLGEFVSDEREADAACGACLEVLQAIADSGVEASLSVKLTQLGLDIDKTLCRTHMRRILDTARALGLMVTIDMEDFSHCQATLDLFTSLREEYDNVGTVIQAYLYRSLDDVLRLSRMGAHLRIVKGAYKESPQVAYPNKADVDANYVKLLEIQLQSPGFTAIATHDTRIIEHAKSFIDQHHIPREKYEFQMLYGIRTQLQAELVQAGYPVRIYVPYGTDWFGYFMRRLAERPANIAFVLRGIWR